MKKAIPISCPDLLGKELIRIGLETYSVEFNFEDWTIEIGAEFCLKKSGRTLTVFHPEDQQGEVAALWPLIGSKIKNIDWSDPIEILFSNNISIEIPPDPNHNRGTVKGPLVGTGMVFENF